MNDRLVSITKEWAERAEARRNGTLPKPDDKEYWAYYSLVLNQKLILKSRFYVQGIVRGSTYLIMSDENKPELHKCALTIDPELFCSNTDIPELAY